MHWPEIDPYLSGGFEPIRMECDFGWLEIEGELPAGAAGDSCAVGEPVFVPAHAGAPEGEGILLSCIFDERSGVSHLAFFDATKVADGPVARAHLRRRVPMGFHATWKPGAAHVM